MMKRSKSHVKNIITVGLGLFLSVIVFAGITTASTTVYAADICTDTNGDKKIDIKDLDPAKPCLFKDDLKTTPDGAAKACSGGDCSGLIKNYVNPFIVVLSSLFGVIATISLVVAGIQIGSAGGDPGKLAAGKKRIYNTLLAIFAYLFMFAFLNWLLPGGIV
jgi:hypothetical protein